MIVRCGRCGVQFQVPGAGRYACPSCGATNEVRAAPAGGAPPGQPGGMPPGGMPPGGMPPGGMPPGGMPPGGADPGGSLSVPGSPPSAPEPAPPSPRLVCPECEFTFIVGDIEVATCPNCGAEVAAEDS